MLEDESVVAESESRGLFIYFSSLMIWNNHGNGFVADVFLLWINFATTVCFCLFSGILWRFVLVLSVDSEYTQENNFPGISDIGL